ncbi:MAG: hypothetical protein R3304_03945 [Longimicrobiales bacterium]|nr:hypothetical protein [Longimicrobiales bacterium]
MWVLAGLVHPTLLGAQIPELPTLQGMGLEYISSSGFFQLLLSGRLDLEGAHVVNGWEPSTSPDASVCDACHVDLGREFRAGEGTLDLFRLRVFADIFLGEHVYSLLEVRTDRGRENFEAPQRTRLEQAFVRLVDGAGRLGIQFGRFSSPFGSYAPRHLTVLDPFLRPPLAYDYRTVMNRWRVPGSTEAFLRWKDSPDDVDLPGAPPVWDVPYQWGAMVFGRVGPVNLRAAAMNSAPSSHPNAWALDPDQFSRPSWVFGARWKASASLDVGASYDRGPWMAQPKAGAILPPEGSPPGTPAPGWREFDQELVSVDVAYARGPVMIRAEGIRDRWEVPNVAGMPSGLSGTLEVQSDLAAGLFVAARGGLIDFRPLRHGSLDGTPPAEEDWDHDVVRFAGSVGYRLSGNTGLLLSGHRQVQRGGPEGDTTFLGLRLWWAF